MKTQPEQVQEPMAKPARSGLRRARVSRRQFIGGAAAATAVLAAGGATPVVVRAHDGGSKGVSPGMLPTVSYGAGGAPPDALNEPDVRLRHLLRRTTFAATAADVARFRGMALDQVTDQLIAEADGDDSAAASAVAALGYDVSKRPDIVATWSARMLLTDKPLLERMTLFWHGLLTSGLSKTGGERAHVMLVQNEFFRQHAFDAFDVLLKGVVRDPAMMLWLDLETSKKGHPNENYARELMELFTLGAGRYTEEDVRESAHAHTGYSLTRDATYVFRPALYDDGPKTFLGQTGNFNADDIVDIILRQDAAPAHFATKVFEAFAYPGPDAATIAPIAEAAGQSGYSAKAVLRAVLTSDAFYRRRRTARSSRAQRSTRSARCGSSASVRPRARTRCSSPGRAGTWGRRCSTRQTWRAGRAAARGSAPARGSPASTSPRR